MTRRRQIWVVAALLAIGSVVAAALVYVRVSHPFKGYSAAEQYVDVPQGSSTRAIGDRLVGAGVVRDRLSFRMALWLTGSARRLKAGEYRFDAPMTAADVLRKLARGDVYKRALTFPEGLTIREMSAIFETRGLGAASAFVAAASDPSAIADLDPRALTLEGYLFPETYAVPRHTPPARLVHIMVDRFRAVFDDALRRDAAARGLSLRHVVTLASLVEKETARPEERPIIAAVYGNRLKIGMGLQCDPTVIYALEQAGRYQGNLTREDLAFDSPYNTYKYAGLPPGPIAAPGQASLEAVVRPAAVDYLYFVSRNDGSHQFARTLAEHDRNVRQFQILYFREKRTRAGERPY